MNESLNLWQRLGNTTFTYLEKAPAALFILLITYIVVRMLKRIAIASLRLAKADDTLRSLVLSIVGFVGWVMGISAALNALGLTQISLALGGSVALVAMALASGLSSIAQDLLAGIFLFIDEDFAIGKRVKAAGIEGVVTHLSIRKTKIRDDQGMLHTVPNRTIDGAVYTVVPQSLEDTAENKGA